MSDPHSSLSVPRTAPIPADCFRPRGRSGAHYRIGEPFARGLVGSRARCGQLLCWPRAILTAGAAPCSSGAARVAGVARSGWTAGPGSSSTHGSLSAQPCPWARCSACSVAPPVGARALPPGSGRSSRGRLRAIGLLEKMVGGQPWGAPAAAGGGMQTWVVVHQGGRADRAGARYAGRANRLPE